MDERMYELVRWLYGCLNGRLDEWVDGRLDGPMDISCPDEWEDGWMDA